LVIAFGEYLLIHDGLTLEGIAGRLSLDFPERKTTYESLYLWIYTERRDLIPYLARGHTKRHKRPSAKKSRISKIPNRIDITERPATVELRRQTGHGEGDTVVSGQSEACVAVLVERKSRFFMVVRMKDKMATAMHEAGRSRFQVFLADCEKPSSMTTGWKTPCMNV
jgi:IS30 family transposase